MCHKSIKQDENTSLYMEQGERGGEKRGEGGGRGGKQGRMERRKKGRTGQDRAGRGITAEFFGAFMLDPAQHTKEEGKKNREKRKIKKTRR